MSLMCPSLVVTAPSAMAIKQGQHGQQQERDYDCEGECIAELNNRIAKSDQGEKADPNCRSQRLMVRDEVCNRGGVPIIVLY